MRNSVAKKLRRKAGKQTSDSNRIYYEQIKTEHKNRGKSVEPAVKISERQKRIGKPSITKTTIVPIRIKRMARRKLKA